MTCSLRAAVSVASLQPRAFRRRLSSESHRILVTCSILLAINIPFDRRPLGSQHPGVSRRLPQSLPTGQAPRSSARSSGSLQRMESLADLSQCASESLRAGSASVSGCRANQRAPAAICQSRGAPPDGAKPTVPGAPVGWAIWRSSPDGRVVVSVARLGGRLIDSCAFLMRAIRSGPWSRRRRCV